MLSKASIGFNSLLLDKQQPSCYLPLSNTIQPQKMKRFLLLVIATASGWFIGLPKPAGAASLGLTVTELTTDSSMPAPDLPFYIYKNFVGAQGQVTSINGFTSLAGVTPSSLTLSFGNLVLSSLTNQDGRLIYTFERSSSLVPYFNLFKDGQVIATSSNIQIADTVNLVSDSPTYGQGTEYVRIFLEGVSDNPFFQDVQQITNGTGLLEINLSTPTAIISSDLGGTVEDRNVFTYTDGLLVAQSPATAVPEPSTAFGSFAFSTLLITSLAVKRKLKHSSKSKMLQR